VANLGVLAIHPSPLLAAAGVVGVVLVEEAEVAPRFEVVPRITITLIMPIVK